LLKLFPAIQTANWPVQKAISSLGTKQIEREGPRSNRESPPEKDWGWKQ
jgi:hypothetical protein